MFVIAGNPDSKKFAYATSVAKFLQKKLPKFDYIVISKLAQEWKDFLSNLNKENNWHFTEEPVIWKELISGGKKYKLGGVSEFWEYIYDYYGLEALLTQSELQQIISKNIETYNEGKITFLSPKRTIISICGASHETTEYLLEEIISMECLYANHGLEIRLNDESIKLPDVKQEICNLAYMVNRYGIFGNKPFVKPVMSLEGAVSECDILILMIDFKVARGKEAKHDLFLRVIREADILADAINKFAKRTLRVVIFNYHCPNCFFANYLIQNATAIKIKNIVVPTSYIGLKFLNVVSSNTGIKISNLSSPPVWGADEINFYIDMRATLYKGHVCRPYKRALTSLPDSTLPLGEVDTELRYLSHLITDEDEFMKEFHQRAHRKKVVLRFPTIFGKVRCMMDILRMWYEGDNESIISLGICSNGTFGLPRGLVLSQPSHLKNGHFVPCKEYPVSERTLEKVKQIGIEIQEIVDQYTNMAPKINSNIINHEK